LQDFENTGPLGWEFDKAYFCGLTSNYFGRLDYLTPFTSFTSKAFSQVNVRRRVTAALATVNVYKIIFRSKYTIFK
jgi:hypothetical protein